MPWYHYVWVLNPLCAWKTFVEVRLGKWRYICITSTTVLTSEWCTIVHFSVIRRGLTLKNHMDYHLASMAWDGSFFFFLRIIHQYVFEDVFSVCLQKSASCSPGCHCRSVRCSPLGGMYSQGTGLSERNLKASDHHLLHLILGKSKCEKSLLKQDLHHQVWVKNIYQGAVCHITCNLQEDELLYFLLLYAPRREGERGGKKSQNYLALHLFPQHLNVANQSLKTVPCRCAQGHRQKWEISVYCTVHPYKHAMQPLKSDSALKKSKFV